MMSSSMKNTGFGLCVMITAVTGIVSVSCGGKNSSSDGNGMPGANATDREKVEYVARMYGPDSLARFICYAALDKSPDGHIDSLAMAQVYALELYAAEEDKVVKFSRTFEETVENLPLTDAYRLTKMTGTLDETQMPLDLGLHYGARVRREKLEPARVKADTTALARMVEPHFFQLFVEAFETAMKN